MSKATSKRRLRTYDRTLARLPCKCHFEDTTCRPDCTGHYGRCPIRQAYFRAVEQSMLWKRLADAIKAEVERRQIFSVTYSPAPSPGREDPKGE
jgi:hypothetical protein